MNWKINRKNFFRIPLIILCTLGPLVAWLGFGDQGFLHLYRTEMERQAYIERIQQLTKENQELLDEITRLRSDQQYVESMARKHFNMIKSNEIVYRFDHEKPPADSNPQQGGEELKQ